MENAEVLGDQKEIINDKLYQGFLNDTIDIKALCCSLGRQRLDDSIMQIELWLLLNLNKFSYLLCL